LRRRRLARALLTTGSQRAWGAGALPARRRNRPLRQPRLPAHRGRG